MKLEKKLAISGVSSVTFLHTYYSIFQNKAVGLSALAAATYLQKNHTGEEE